MNHYELLGVDRDATQEGLARAYRELARQHHPDRNGRDTAEATKRMVAINQAFEVLSGPIKRFGYNRSLEGASSTAQKRPTSGTDPGVTQPEQAKHKQQPPPDDPVRRRRREAKERAAADAKRRGYRDPSAGLYVPGFFRSSERDDDFDYVLDRATMHQAVKGLVDQGMRQIAELLRSAEIAESEVSLCLVTGGMSSMPEIRGRLYELFGPQRVELSSRSATLVSDGAAWFAHDEARLVLARRVEFELARGSRFPVLNAGTGTPSEGWARRPV